MTTNDNNSEPRRGVPCITAGDACEPADTASADTTSAATEPAVATSAAISILILVLVCFLGCNYGTATCINDVSQVSQWRQFCIRGVAAGVALAVAMLMRKRGSGIRYAIEASIIAVCTVEAAYSILQLYGLLPSFHSLFKLTGSFYNPGPLGGYIAMGLPIAVDMLLGISRRPLGTPTSKIIRCALYASLSIMAMALPSTMSRTAWVAAAVSVTYVLCGRGRIQPIISKTGIRPRILAMASAVLAVAAGILLWHIKRDSAMGRLLLWKISWRAIMDSPISGHDSFAEAYGLAQENYFAQGGATEAERLVAGSPDYAFNEYLQIGVEYGLPVLAAVAGLLIITVLRSWRHKTFGLSGAVLAFMVFAFAGYPLHLPAFVGVLLLSLLGIWFCGADGKMSAWPVMAVVIVWTGISALYIKPYTQKERPLVQWSKMQFLYHNKQYHAVADRYAAILGDMLWNGRFLYEYGHSLFKIKKYEESIPVLEQAVMQSADPMILNIIGECHQALGRYQEAEMCYKRAALRIPCRLYPHYLLYFLYCEPGFQNDSLRRQEYHQVMTLEIKKESPATRDLRRKVKEREAEF